MKVFLLIFLWSISFTSMSIAKANVTVREACEASFTHVDKIEHKVLFLTTSQYEKVTKKAKTKINTKIYRYYNIFSEGEQIGTGVLITRKMRTKKATILYAFDTNDTLRFTEIMAFGEPPEFIPNSTWMGQFQNQKPTVQFTIGKDIPTISGSTLSARSITQGARIARVLYEIMLESK